MGAIIWIIVIIVVISSFVRNNAAGKSKKGSSGAKQSGPADASVQRTGEASFYKKQAKPNKPKPGTKTAKPNKPKPGTKTAKPNQPQTEKAPVMRQMPTGDADKTRYGSYKQARQQGQSPSSALRQTHVDDILESARENNQDVQLDNDMDMIEIGDLMAKVQDNIVMGPADTLAFQRDFVAEGMDLLNRYTMIPETEA